MNKKLSKLLSNDSIDAKGEEILKNYEVNRKIIQGIFVNDKKPNQSKDFKNPLTKNKRFDYKSFMNILPKNRTYHRNKTQNLETAFNNNKKINSIFSYKQRNTKTEKIKPLSILLNENKKNIKKKFLYANNTANTSRNNTKKNLIDSKKEFSYLSTDYQQKKILTHKKHYSLNNNNSKRRKELIRSSADFFKFHDEENFLKSLKNVKKAETVKNMTSIFDHKIVLYSKIKKIKSNVAFGQGYSFPLNKKSKNNTPNEKTFNQKNIFIPNDENLIDTQNIDCYKNKKDIVKSSKKSKIPRNIFGIELIPQLTKKKILKNILPKEVDYNTEKDISDIIQEETFPLLRFQKKTLTQNTNILGQEINDLFSKYFSLNGSSRNEHLTGIATNKKFFNLIKEFLEKSENKNIKKLNKELKKLKTKQLLKHKYLYKKIKKTMIFIARKMKRYDISLKFLLSFLENKEKYIKENGIENYNQKLNEEGIYLFTVIKAGDIEEIINILNKTPNAIFYKDEFNQTPLHILAKRNIYQLVSLFISRLANINAQDLTGRTPLMIAAQRGYKEFVTMLLYEIADPNIKDHYGKKACEMTNNAKLKTLLIYIGSVYNFLYNFGSIKKFDCGLQKSLEYFYSFVLEIDYNFENLLLYNKVELEKAEI